MNDNYSDFHVNLLGSNGRRINITGAWKPGFFANDTWESNSVEIPADFPDGTARLAVRASRLAVPPGLDTSNQELDTDGDGFSNADEDTQVNSFRNYLISLVGNGRDLIPQLIVRDLPKFRMWRTIAAGSGTTRRRTACRTKGKRTSCALAEARPAPGFAERRGVPHRRSRTGAIWGHDT